MTWRRGGVSGGVSTQLFRPDCITSEVIVRRPFSTGAYMFQLLNNQPAIIAWWVHPYYLIRDIRRVLAHDILLDTRVARVEMPGTLYSTMYRTKMYTLLLHIR